MELVERYLHAVRRNLPPAKADDIVAELRDELLTRIEGVEAAHGRALTDDEAGAILRDAGHPLVVAGRYRRNQYLIGPETFPFYLATLKVVLAAGLALLAGLAIFSLAAGEGDLDSVIARTVEDLSTFAFAAAGIITIVFAVLERNDFPANHVAKWAPDQLPELDDQPQGAWRSAIEVGLGIAFLLWWTGAVSIPAGPIRIEAGPAFAAYYMPVLLLVSAQLAVNVLKWLRPRWQTPTRFLSIGLTVATVALIASIYRAGTWVTATAVNVDASHATRIAESVNLSIKAALLVTAVALIIQALGEARKLLLSRQRASGAAAAI